MLELSINEELCVGCGACVKDCVTEVLVMKNGRPALSPGQEEECIRCQHCMAVCPTGALGIMGLSPDTAPALPVQIPSDTDMEMLIKSRRSTRQYRDEAVDRALLERLLAITAYAPTGSNSDQVRLTVINDSDSLARFRSRLYAAIQARTLPKELARFKDMVMDWERGRDTLFRNAPHMVVASAPAQVTSPVTDSIIALSYFELQAATMGIGTTWCGLVKIALAQIAPELLADLQIPEDHELGYVMLFGLPRVRYHRTVQRKSDRVNYIRF